MHPAQRIVALVAVEGSSTRVQSCSEGSARELKSVSAGRGHLTGTNLPSQGRPGAVRSAAMDAPPRSTRAACSARILACRILRAEPLARASCPFRKDLKKFLGFDEGDQIDHVHLSHFRELQCSGWSNSSEHDKPNPRFDPVRIGPQWSKSTFRRSFRRRRRISVRKSSSARRVADGCSANVFPRAGRLSEQRRIAEAVDEADIAAVCESGLH